MDKTTGTLLYYEQNANSFADNAANTDMEEMRSWFDI